MSSEVKEPINGNEIKLEDISADNFPEWYSKHSFSLEESPDSKKYDPFKVIGGDGD